MNDAPTPRLTSLPDPLPEPAGSNSRVATLVAITGADWSDIFPAAIDAKTKVRGEGAHREIADLSVLEMDYAFTNLGYFLSRVGDYRQRTLTLAQWAEKPRAASIFYAVEVHYPGSDRSADGEVLAVLGDAAIELGAKAPSEIRELPAADHPVGQVFTVTAMADARWSA